MDMTQHAWIEEAVRDSAARDEVFPTAFLVWTDAESGEELGLALCGPDELVRSLLDHGFELATHPEGEVPLATARILAITRGG